MTRWKRYWLLLILLNTLLVGFRAYEMGKGKPGQVGWLLLAAFVVVGSTVLLTLEKDRS